MTPAHVRRALMEHHAEQLIRSWDGRTCPPLPVMPLVSVRRVATLRRPFVVVRPVLMPGASS